MAKLKLSATAVHPGLDGSRLSGVLFAAAHEKIGGKIDQLAIVSFEGVEGNACIELRIVIPRADTIDATLTTARNRLEALLPDAEIA